MKKLLFLIPALIFTVSCQNDDDDDFYMESSSEAKHEKVFDRSSFESNFESEYYQQTNMFEKGKDSIPDKDLSPWRSGSNNGGSQSGN